MLSAPLAEPDCDVQAQIAALLDQAHPKDAVYLSPANRVPGDLPATIRVVPRPYGTLLTTNPDKAAAFDKPDLSDDDMAAILGLPEPKSSIGSIVIVVQARDSTGAVITEAATSPRGMAKTMEALSNHVPPGGKLQALTIFDALLRRANEVNGHGRTA